MTQLEEMRYIPEIELCFVTRGTLKNGNMSKGCVWTKFHLRQISQDGRYYFKRDTYDHQNPLIFKRSHLMDNAAHYVERLMKVASNHHEELLKHLRRKKLSGPYVTFIQKFDSNHGQMVFGHWNENPPTITDLEEVWLQIVAHQSVVS